MSRYHLQKKQRKLFYLYQISDKTQNNEMCTSSFTVSQHGFDGRYLELDGQGCQIVFRNWSLLEGLSPSLSLWRFSWLQHGVFGRSVVLWFLKEGLQTWHTGRLLLLMRPSFIFIESSLNCMNILELGYLVWSSSVFLLFFPFFCFVHPSFFR